MDDTKYCKWGLLISKDNDDPLGPYILISPPKTIKSNKNGKINLHVTMLSPQFKYRDYPSFNIIINKKRKSYNWIKWKVWTQDFKVSYKYQGYRKTILTYKNLDILHLRALLRTLTEDETYIAKKWLQKQWKFCW